jgi:hypothetical protein
VPDAGQHEAGKVSVVEFLRQYSLREYIAVLAVAIIGGVGVVFLLNSAGAGPATGETIALKRAEDRSAPPESVRVVESEAIAAERRAKERAKVLAERRRIRAMRAARAERRAAVAARSRAARRTVVRSAPRPAASAPIRAVNRTPAPAPKPKPAPVSAPSPKKSGSSGGGGGGTFDDSG